ncbi:MAG: nucleotide exchange factor GrpE [Candidatus Levybacteria bacterium]|nr:nucleotide exchange factor GrpE [Candidatus Levybacteria bacterium]MBI3093180.1 nucleotide exchange factor GrpE [Candidatus Levybacteria bacterium]
MTKKNERTKETEELKQRIEDLENKYKRALADYQNLEKRAKEERSAWIKTANKELILQLLPVLDTLILADQHVPNEGLQLSIQQFISALKTEGVEKVETIGKQFDPITMECIETLSGEEGKVLEEVRFGYKLYDLVLRPAQVKVGKGE